MKSLKTLVASILAERITADVYTIYALAVIAKDELGLNIPITPIAVEETLKELAREKYIVEYTETSIDMKRRERKYIVTDKLKEIAKPLPPKTRAVANFKYVTPVFYLFLNYGLI